LSREDRQAGYDWQLSIWQMEVSLTQIFDRPQKGREFFEEVMRDNLDLGRPDRLPLIFERRVTKATPGPFRTRVMQEGVHPSLHIQYKNFDLNQYFKEGRGLRTEGTFRNPKDFEVNKGLANLPYLQRLGRHINRRLLDVERVSHNCGLTGDSIQKVVQPPSRRTVRGRRVEVWRSAGDGSVGGPELVHALDPGLPQSPTAGSRGRLVGSRARLLRGSRNDV
jgi:hypothetical protein